jgi:hypothetical protein
LRPVGKRIIIRRERSAVSFLLVWINVFRGGDPLSQRRFLWRTDDCCRVAALMESERGSRLPENRRLFDMSPNVQ